MFIYAVATHTFSEPIYPDFGVWHVEDKRYLKSLLFDSVDSHDEMGKSEI